MENPNNSSYLPEIQAWRLLRQFKLQKSKLSDLRLIKKS